MEIIELFIQHSRLLCLSLEGFAACFVILLDITINTGHFIKGLDF